MTPPHRHTWASDAIGYRCAGGVGIAERAEDGHRGRKLKVTHYRVVVDIDGRRTT